MKKSHFIPAFLLSAALLSGLAGCKKETEYYNPNAQKHKLNCKQNIPHKLLQKNLLRHPLRLLLKKAPKLPLKNPLLPMLFPKNLL